MERKMPKIIADGQQQATARLKLTVVCTLYTLGIFIHELHRFIFLICHTQSAGRVKIFLTEV
jgi:hypothetical protein